MDYTCCFCGDEHTNIDQYSILFKNYMRFCSIGCFNEFVKVYPEYQIRKLREDECGLRHVKCFVNDCEEVNIPGRFFLRFKKVYFCSNHVHTAYWISISRSSGSNKELEIIEDDKAVFEIIVNNNQEN